MQRKEIYSRSYSRIVNTTVKMIFAFVPTVSLQLLSRILNRPKIELFKFFMSDKFDKALRPKRKLILISSLFSFPYNLSKNPSVGALATIRESLIFLLVREPDCVSRFELSTFFGYKMSEIFDIEERGQKSAFETLKNILIMGMKESKLTANEIAKVVHLTEEDKKHHSLEYITEDEILYEHKSSGKLSDAEITNVKSIALNYIVDLAKLMDISYEEFVNLTNSVLILTEDDDELLNEAYKASFKREK